MCQKKIYDYKGVNLVTKVLFVTMKGKKLIVSFTDFILFPLYTKTIVYEIQFITYCLDIDKI